MSELVPPRFATARDDRFDTWGTRQAEFAKIWLGRPLLPHQRLIADVAGEITEDGLPRHKLVVVTFQRQGGKSHLSMSKNGERCMSLRNCRCLYTAQTGGDAQEQFLKFNDEIVKDTALERIVRVRRGNGKADMTFPNGSTIRPKPPTEKAGHGAQSDQADIDEAWAHSEEEGKAIMQALAPTQATRPYSQTWVWSAGGTAASTWLAALVARGRAGDPSLAYFEWSVPDDLDVNDLEGVLSYHPAAGTLITLDSLRAMRTKMDDDAEFARAAGNRWTEVIGGALDWKTWQMRRWDLDIPESAPVGYGAARAADGSHVVIAAAAEVDGQVVVEVVDVLPVFGAAAAVKAWAGGDGLVIDPNGPSATLADEVRRLGGVQLLDFNTRDASAACANVIDALASGAYRYRKHDALDAAVQVAGTRAVGDGGRAWARLAAGAPIAALEAATNAAWAVLHRAPKVGKPVIRFGGTAA